MKKDDGEEGKESYYAEDTAIIILDRRKDLEKLTELFILIHNLCLANAFKSQVTI